MIKPSLLKPFEEMKEEDLEMSFPEPRVGDVVSYEGKWQDESSLGRIRDLQLRNDTDGNQQWFADVIPLKEGKSEAVYVIDRDGKSTFEELIKLKPVRSFFVRAENGYRIAFRSNSTTEVVMRAPKYRSVSSDFTLPKVAVNQEVRANDLAEYAQLKARLLKNTLLFGAVGAVGTSGAFGMDVGVPYMLGVVAGATYLFLLGKKTDSVGSNMVQGQETPAPEVGTTNMSSKLESYIVDGRLLTAVLLMAVLTKARPLLGGADFNAAQFRVITRGEYLGAVGGFLTYMVALIVTEVGGELRAEDVLSILPGSIAEGFRQAKKAQGGEEEDNAPPPPVPVVFVTGPRAAGRADIVTELLRRDTESASGSARGPSGGGGDGTVTRPPPLRRVRYLTTSQAMAAAAPSMYTFASEAEIDALRSENALLYEGTVEPILGEAFPIFLPLDDIVSEYGRNAARGDTPAPVQVLEGNPALLDALSKVPELRLINVWVSLQTKEQFMEKATDIVKAELGSARVKASEKDVIVKNSAAQVGLLVNEAARDITFYMGKAPLFEYTLLNSVSDGVTADELLTLLQNVL